MNYKAVLCGIGFLQELELKENSKSCSIGTNKGNIVRFDKRRIGEEFQVDLIAENNTWKFTASSGVVFVLQEKETFEIYANPGDKICVYSSLTKEEIFKHDLNDINELYPKKWTQKI